MDDFRAWARNSLATLFHCQSAMLENKARDILADDCVFYISAPLEKLTGITSILANFITPLRDAFTRCHRRDLLFIGGENTRSEGGNWVACMTHYVGNLTARFCGIGPFPHLVFLRAGEFYRVAEGKIIEGRIIIDLPDLLCQIGQNPFMQKLGSEILFPPPATQDGILPKHREKSRQTLALVEAMLADLAQYDPNSFASKNQTGPNGYWHPQMFWYGPAGIGSNYTYPGFDVDHRIPFLTAFPDRRGGNHFCRIGDGDYAAVSGWPSMKMTHKGDYLGIKATYKACTLRVMDFYRCDNGKIHENWVMLDYVDLFKQMGVNLLPNDVICLK